MPTARHARCHLLVPFILATRCRARDRARGADLLSRKTRASASHLVSRRVQTGDDRTHQLDRLGARIYAISALARVDRLPKSHRRVGYPSANRNLGSKLLSPTRYLPSTPFRLPERHRLSLTSHSTPGRDPGLRLALLDIVSYTTIGPVLLTYILPINPNHTALQPSPAHLNTPVRDIVSRGIVSTSDRTWHGWCRRSPTRQLGNAVLTLMSR
nr:hypothetical protein CFP56_32437 [Quercus suber]